jgi:hypothetical protein
MAREARLQLLSSYETIELAEAALNEVCEAAEIRGETATGPEWRCARRWRTRSHGNKQPEKRVYVEIVAAPHALNGRRGRGEGFDRRCSVIPGTLRTSCARPVAVSSTSALRGRVVFSAAQAAARVELVRNLNSNKSLSLRRE